MKPQVEYVYVSDLPIMCMQVVYNILVVKHSLLLHKKVKYGFYFYFLCSIMMFIM
jgi:hypothetical protein